MASGSGYYGVLYPSFWTGKTGQALRKAGGKDALLLGAYLTSNGHMNMIGLYELRLRDIHDELGLSRAAITKAFHVLESERFAFFDEATSFVWVHEMARIRLNVQADRPLAKDDNKVIGAQRLYSGLPENPFLGPFFDRYGKVLHLKTRREMPSPENSRQGSPSEGAPKGLQRGLKASSTDPTETDPSGTSGTPATETGTSEKSSAADAARPAAGGNGKPAGTADNLSVITKLAHEAIRDGTASIDLPEVVKVACAQHHIPYSSAVVRKAIESAQAQRRAAR